MSEAEEIVQELGGRIRAFRLAKGELSPRRQYHVLGQGDEYGPFGGTG